MLRELNARLIKTIEQKRLKEKLVRDVQSVEKELQEKSTQLAALGIQLDREKVDVEKLEHMSLTSLFYTVLGGREQQMEKERQELLSVQLLYQQAARQVEFLEQEKIPLLDRLVPLANIESEYEALLSEKDSRLRQSGQGVATELVSYSEQLAELNSELREITEAVSAGNELIADLEQVVKSLGSAQGWGMWDLLGGGFISDMVKHSHIDEARNRVNNAQAKISQFKRELADVQKTIELQINIGELESFADFFFDGLIFDWIVQSKIDTSLAQVEKAKYRIAQTVKELENLQVLTQDKRNDIQKKRTLLIERT